MILSHSLDQKQPNSSFVLGYIQVLLLQVGATRSRPLALLLTRNPGVLRGQKSRFQLFGDTVNTASRMESTGDKSRIQVSQQTADELVSMGKGHWLVSRDDKVVAKGKGELATYWLQMPSLKSNDSVSSGLPTQNQLVGFDDTFPTSL